MRGSDVTKILSPLLLLLLVATTLLIAPIDASVNDEDNQKDPMMKDVKVETFPISEVEVEIDNHAFDHVMNNNSQNELFSALIRYGKEVTSSKYPFMVSLQRTYSNPEKRYHFCAAVLLDERTALTAAHCMYNWKLYDKRGGVYGAIGFVKLSSTTGTLVRVVDVYLHPNYKHFTRGYPNDIAVVVFEQEVTFKSSVQPASLTNIGKRRFDASRCDLAGWGHTEHHSYPDELYYIQQYWLTNYQCELLHRAFFTGLIRHNHLCTYAPKTSPCYGDSGGPVICDGKVSGLISWTVSCTGCFGSIHTRVSSHRKWITEMQEKAIDEYCS